MKNGAMAAVALEWATGGGEKREIFLKMRMLVGLAWMIFASTASSSCTMCVSSCSTACWSSLRMHCTLDNKFENSTDFCNITVVDLKMNVLFLF